VKGDAQLFVTKGKTSSTSEGIVIEDDVAWVNILMA
jgi:hypothetical protein